MKKGINILILISLMLVVLVGCNLSQVNPQESYGLDYNIIDDFAKSKDIKILYSCPIENAEVIAYKKENEYGIMKIFKNKSSAEIKYIKKSINIDNYKNGIACMQLRDAQENYIAIFILDKDIRQNAVNVKIDFADQISPIAVQKTTIRNKEALIIPYSSGNESRSIGKVTIRDANNNIIKEYDSSSMKELIGS